MPKIKLNQRKVDSFTSKKHPKKVDYYDTEVNGLLLKVLKSGKGSYYIRFKDERNAYKEKVLCSADASAMSLKNARELARNKLSQIAMGEDPFSEAGRLAQIPKFADFVHDEYLPHAMSYKLSWKTDESLLRNHILPALGSYHMDQIKHRQLNALFSKHRKMHAADSTNRIIILCRTIFNYAMKADVPLERNPTDGINQYPVNNKCERYLTHDEANRLFEAAKTSKNPMIQHIIQMLLFTGARKREVLDAKWEDFDYDNRVWKIKFTKGGEARYVPLSDAMVDVLASVPSIKDCDWVFANPESKKPYQHIWYAWNVVRKRAGLEDVRIHDLRHSYASFLVNKGQSLYVVQKLLGHTQIKTTQRYAHLSNETLLNAANGMSEGLMAAIPANDEKDNVKAG